jgi:hypothetical protein
MQPMVNDIGNLVAVITEFAAAQGMTVVHATTVPLSLNPGPGGADQTDLPRSGSNTAVSDANRNATSGRGGEPAGRDRRETFYPGFRDMAGSFRAAGRMEAWTGWGDASLSAFSRATPGPG